MSWTQLSQRLALLPFILAGPILRRTEPDAVTVWIALRKPSEIALSVYPTDNGNDVLINQLILEGSCATVPLGKYLHVAAVTAKPVNSNRLQPGQIYAYHLNFSSHEGGLLKALNSVGFPEKVTISYFEHQLPTFAMPPDDLNHLRIVHGSCRKPHGGGRDSLPILDDLIAQHMGQANSRPQQLFLTGDQIYGDDVADPLLWAVTEAGNTLLGWEEDLPVGSEYKKASELKPGQRSDIARDYGGFTAMLVNQPEKAKSHLFSLGEYYAMYMFAWSQVLWPSSFPKGREIYEDSKQAKLWDEEVNAIQGFAHDLWKVRRVLANVPTYMICDDHDISDDWYLNREWCNRVLGKPLGRCTVLNGLLGYALFQAWGNTPDQFMPGQPGERLLQAAQNWSASTGTDEFAWEEIAKCLGMPPIDPTTALPEYKLDEHVLVLNRNYPDQTPSLQWHYTVRSFKHEVIVLDTRNWRGYPQQDTMQPPMLLCPTAFKQQIRQPLEQTDQINQAGDSGVEATLVIIPTNLVHLSVIDLVQRLHLTQDKVFGSDVGDSWNLNEEASSQLLAELFRQRDRVVVLSGDIHYSCAVRLNYWFRRHFGDAELDPDAPEKPRVLAQLTASSFKNEELTTNIAHTKLKSIFPEPIQDWAGWNEPPQLVEIQTIHDRLRLMEVDIPEQKPIVRPVKRLRGNEDITWEVAVKDKKSLPHWRYHIEWINREKAQEVWTDLQPIPREKKRGNPTSFYQKKFKNFTSSLWKNQWLQEGDEVVGYNNFGLISFQWSQNDDAKAVFQDVYWRSSWEPTCIVFSRYSVSLRLDNPPPLPKVIFSESSPIVQSDGETQSDEMIQSDGEIHSDEMIQNDTAIG